MFMRLSASFRFLSSSAQAVALPNMVGYGEVGIEERWLVACSGG
jgi:hypothetical protein